MIYLVSLLFGVVLISMPLPDTSLADCREIAAASQSAIDAKLAVRPGAHGGKVVTVGDLEVVCSYIPPVEGKPLTQGTPA